MKNLYKTIETPVGKLKIIARDEGLVALLWENDDPKRIMFKNLEEDPQHTVLVETEKQIREYFSGQRTSFTVPLAMEGTEFQKKVWAALLTIPFGETRSYGQLARLIGREKAARAVGAANKRNPISIIVPCHRVIGSGGAMVGFAGGLPIKTHLLKHERKL